MAAAQAAKAALTTPPDLGSMETISGGQGIYHISAPIDPAIANMIFDGNGVGQTYIPPPAVTYDPSNFLPLNSTSSFLTGDLGKYLLIAGLGIILLKKKG
jgi:hypothetical protein